MTVNLNWVSPCENILSIKKAPMFPPKLFVINAWRCPTLTWGDPTLPSALNGFTSEFEMGSGGSHSLWSPSKLACATTFAVTQILEMHSIQVYVFVKCYFTTLNVLECYMVKPHGQLVLVSFTHYCASTPSLSTS